MTNHENLKSMSLDEMANFLKNSVHDFVITLNGETMFNNVDYIKEWLEKEVK